MNSEQRERMRILCEKLQAETDPGKFSQLLVDLDDLLETRDRPGSERLRRAPKYKLTDEESYKPVSFWVAGS